MASPEAVHRPGLPPHLGALLDWIKDFVSSEQCSEILSDLPTEAAKEAILVRSAEGGGRRMLARIGQHLPAIFGGEVESLDVMLRGDSAEQSICGWAGSRRLSSDGEVS